MCYWKLLFFSQAILYPDILLAQSSFYGAGNLLPICLEESSGTTKRIFLPQSMVAAEDNKGVTFEVPDHLGSAHLIINQDGSLRSAGSYEPYGGRKGIAEEQNDRYRYTGTYTWNASARLYSSPTRKYESTSRNFLSADGLRSNPSPYIYTGGNPVNWLDAAGLAPTDASSLSNLIVSRFWHVPDAFHPKPERSDYVAMNRRTIKSAIANLELVRGTADMMYRSSMLANKPAAVPAVMEAAANTYLQSYTQYPGIMEMNTIDIKFANGIQGRAMVYSNNKRLAFSHPSFRQHAWQLGDNEYFVDMVKELSVMSLARQSPLPESIYADLIASYLVRLSETEQVIRTVEICAHPGTNAQSIWINRLRVPEKESVTLLLDVREGAVYNWDELSNGYNEDIVHKYLPVVAGDPASRDEFSAWLYEQKQGSFQRFMYLRQ